MLSDTQSPRGVEPISAGMPEQRDRVEIGDRVIEGAADGGAADGGAGGRPGPGGRPFLRLWFRCSGQYARAYRSADGTVYLGRCPKCGATSRFLVGPGGTNQRFFEVSCVD
jgi:hypothetical protein